MPRGISALSLHTLHSQYRGPMIFNEEGAAGENGEEAKAKADAAAKADAQAKAEAEKGKGDNSAEDRVKKALEKAKAAEDRAKALEDADKKRLEEEAIKRGDHEKLLKQKDEELNMLKGDHESKSKTLEAYEKAALEQINAKLAGIKDEKRRADVKALLEGRPVLEQFALVDKALSLAGGSGDFGGATPAGGEIPKDAKKKRYAELLAKADLTPSERAESRKLMVELSEFANADKGAFDQAK